MKRSPESCRGVPLLPAPQIQSSQPWRPLLHHASVNRAGCRQQTSQTTKFIRWLKRLDCREERRPESRMQAADGLLEIRKRLSAVDSNADGSLCWNDFDYLNMFTKVLHGQSTEAANSLLVKMWISCCHYHPVELISVNVIYSVWIQPVYLAWCQNMKYNYRLLWRCWCSSPCGRSCWPNRLWNHGWTKRISAVPFQQVIHQLI